MTGQNKDLIKMLESIANIKNKKTEIFRAIKPSHLKYFLACKIAKRKL